MVDKKCWRCKAAGRFSVLMAPGKDRWYVPNQNARTSGPPLLEVWLCEGCAHELDSLVTSFLPILGDWSLYEDRPPSLFVHMRDK